MKLDSYVPVQEPDIYLNKHLPEHKHTSLIHCPKATFAAAAPNKSTLQHDLKVKTDNENFCQLLFPNHFINSLTAFLHP